MSKSLHHLVLKTLLQELQRLENNDEEESVTINRAWVCQICPDFVEYNGASDPKCDGNEKINRCKCILIRPSSANRLSANKCNTECDLCSKSSLCLLGWCGSFCLWRMDTAPTFTGVICAQWAQITPAHPIFCSDLRMLDLNPALQKCVLIRLSVNRLSANKCSTKCDLWTSALTLDFSQSFSILCLSQAGSATLTKIYICSSISVLDLNSVILQCWFECNMFLSNPLDGLKTTSRICNSPNIESYCAIKSK